MHSCNKGTQQCSFNSTPFSVVSLHMYIAGSYSASLCRFHHGLAWYGPWYVARNLIPRAHMPFGQHHDTELCNNEQSRSQSPHAFCFQNVILLFLQIQISTFLVFPVCFECLCVMYPHQLYLWTSCNPRYACAMKLELLKSWTLEINHSRAPCLGADQKACGLWKRA